MEEKRRDQRLYDRLQAANPQITRLLESIWPRLSELIRTDWVKRLNYEGITYELYLELVLTLATNMELLDHQYSAGGTTLTNIILHYHIPEETAGTKTRPFSKTKKLLLRGIAYPEDPGWWMVTWLPLPMNATHMVIYDHVVDHFEYLAERDLYTKSGGCTRRESAEAQTTASWVCTSASSPRIP